MGVMVHAARLVEREDGWQTTLSRAEVYTRGSSAVYRALGHPSRY
jgi:hypothetical protein